MNGDKKVELKGESIILNKIILDDLNTYKIIGDIPEEKREDFVKKAIIIGTIGLKNIYLAENVDYVEKEFKELLKGLEIQSKDIKNNLEKEFRDLLKSSEIQSKDIKNNLEKEFNKLLNKINIYGYDLVSVLRNVAFNSPSAKLAELFNGMATTITSGGDLANFFEKRAESLLFDHRLEREKYTKTAETFMDIYISVVVAAPMILMLLLMMMQISGLGVSLSPTALSLIMVLGVTVINIFFLTFLHLKQPSE